ncbi:DUF3616 domain-containing protein [Accumulibacter sp.]|uniref:DUF3616 domain-containing protein n=1 Tax=Accumulibacter sp. TaxID=2053492 RepID=UPI0025F74EDA|nr:DUF3616 domain-containing protein [Accumulibacter sp.]MCM8611006.1 DUF3616 domain-containing protein [Accumulibacter sp.]MCM8634826.1 DUF3616 domain-containing protein [Accumulibacter sp.]MCM8638380.1 DUF3616 domain-containing protein [Accumulibacter sp.]
MRAEDIPRFRPLTGCYEPSGIYQLDDGRFIVVEDEEECPLSLLQLDDRGPLACTPLRLPAAVRDDGEHWRFDDLEAVTGDHAGRVYAVTSHSRNKAGDARPAREKLLRFRVAAGEMIEARVVVDLKHALTAAHPLLAAAAGIRQVKKDGGLNIEGLAMRADRRVLMLGFRSPLLDGRAIIACLENPDAMFDAGRPPQIANQMFSLDLHGQGIRAVAHVPLLDGYLVVAGPVGREPTPFSLWFWRGGQQDLPQRVSVRGLRGFGHAEGVASALIGGRQWIVLVSDDGSRTDGRCANYLLVDPRQLQIGYG